MNRAFLIAIAAAVLGRKDHGGIVVAMANAAGTTACIADAEPCQAGCFLGVSETCIEAPVGHYSPIDDNDLHICPEGTFAEPGSEQCTPCPRGSFASGPGLGACPLCSPGTYADQKGSTTCSPCSSDWYFGPGSPEVWGNGKTIFCLDPRFTPSPAPKVTTAPSLSPSLGPSLSLAPSQAPSASHSASPSRSVAPSVAPSAAPTTPPSLAPSMTPTTVSSQHPTTSPTRSDDDDQEPPPTPEVHHEQFRKAFRDYLPLIIVAFVFFAVGFIYRRFFRVRKTRRPPRTAPPAPPLPLESSKSGAKEEVDGDSGNESAVDLEAQQYEPKMIPKRAKLNTVS